MELQTSSRQRLLALPLIVALAACGGASPEEEAVAPELGLNGPSVVELIWGSSTSLEFTLERNETATGEVSLTIEGLPEGVTGHFEPAVVTGAALNATLHLEAARDAAGEVARVIVRASGAEALVADHIFALHVRGLTVEGRIEPLAGGALSQGLFVKVGDQRGATDAQGHFVAHQVAVPYDLVVTGAMMTEIYPDLTTATPLVRGFIDGLALPESDGLRLSGTITPTPASGERVTICAGNAPAYGDVCRVVAGNGTDNTYTLNVPLSEDFSDELRVVARREVLDGAGRSVGFNGYAEAVVPDAPENDRVVNFTLEASSSSAIDFTLDAGSHGVAQVIGRVSYGARINGSTPLAPGIFHLPEGAQGSIVALVNGESGVGAITLQPVTGPLDGPITFAPPVELLSPADGSTLTSDSEFVTEADAEGLTSHLFMTSKGMIFVHTFEDRLRFEDLARHIDGLKPADVMQWLVSFATHVTTPDAALEETVGYYGTLLLVASPYGHEPRTEPLRMAVSSGRSFTGELGPAASATSPLEELEARLMR